MADTVLIITNPGDAHADAVVRELQRRGVPVFRFHPQEYPERSWLTIEVRDGRVQGELATRHHRVSLDNISAAWYRRQGIPTPASGTDPAAREYVEEQPIAAIRTLCAILDVFWIANPFVLRLAEVKALQLVRAAEAGLTTPHTLISNDPLPVARFRDELGAQTCAVKSLRVVGAATEDGWRFPLTAVLPADHPLDSVALAPTVFQPYIEKAAEYRCVVIGERIFPVRLDSQAHNNTATDWRGGWVFNNHGHPSPPSKYEPDALPPHVRHAIRSLMRSFPINFASLDMILTPDGEFVFLELNPNGQWLWLELELGIPLTAALTDLLLQEPAATDVPVQMS